MANPQELKKAMENKENKEVHGSVQQEQTFTTFTPEQAARYATERGSSYSPALYQRILDFHGPRQRGAILDVGTGPGKVVFDFLPYFGRGLGCDTSKEMIEQAKRDAVRLGADEKTGWTVSGGETCGEAFPGMGEGVDLITVAMAAHWFDMHSFYSSASKILKPGGTLAMWTCSSYYAHPSNTNWKQIDRILHNLEDDMLGPYALPGNMISRNAYDDLKLPWDFADTTSLFERESFVRDVWDRDGVPSARNSDGTPGEYMQGDKQTLGSLMKGFGSSSMVIRWREANPEKANGEEDPVSLTVDALRGVVGPEEEIVLGSSTTLLLLRRA